MCLVVVSEAWCPFCVAAIEEIARFREELEELEELEEGDQFRFMVAERMEGHGLRSLAVGLVDPPNCLPVPHFRLFINGLQVALSSASFRSEDGALIGVQVARNMEAVVGRIQEVVERGGGGGVRL